MTENTYVVHHNTKVAHMPSQLRHTNYGTKASLVNPQVTTKASQSCKV